MKSPLIFIIVGGVGVVILSLLLWFFFFAAPAQAPNTPGGAGLGSGTTQNSSVSVVPNTSQSENQTAPLSQNSAQKVFKIVDGPVTGATFVQTFNPTTTLARFVLQENGHVQDQPLDVPGSLPRAVSNTTIPGTARALWGGKGEVLYMQYLEDAVIKTVVLLFSQATSSRSATTPVRILFLPDNLVDLSPSPDGKQVAYLVRSGTGVDGYIANPDGSNSKRLFSLGFTQLLLSWPSANTLLITTKSSAASSGVVFSVDVRTGDVLPRIYAAGLTALANRTFEFILYQALSGGAERSSFLRSTTRGADATLSFNPIPEKCVWGLAATSTVYCATPLTNIGADYLDRWHQGTASAPDAIISFSVSSNIATEAIAVPGSSDGGVESDVLELAVSPDEKYLLFVKKGDRSLWGVRLAQ
jgi:hypothetical protein